jgi:transposase InsO family protein
VKQWLTQKYTVVDLAAAYGVSERVAHKAIARFKEEGFDGLRDRSRARHTQDCTPLDVTAALVDARREHPTWGPKKLRALLVNWRPTVDWPAPSTIGTILSKYGLVAERRRRRARAVPTRPCVGAVNCNDSWSMDYKGQFRTTDGKPCYPFTVTDNVSRYILCCSGLRRPTLKETWAELVTCFRENGLPVAIRSDNGTPFAGTGLTRLSTLSVRLIRLGIIPDFIAPASPQQNGRHERMHRTLKQETAAPPAGNLSAQQRRFNRFVEEFNQIRPHEALDDDVPATVHTRSEREMPELLPSVEYDEGTITRVIRRDGCFSWDREHVFLSETLAHQHVAFDQLDDTRFIVRFSFHAVAIFDALTKTLHPAGTRPHRKLRRRLGKSPSPRSPILVFQTKKDEEPDLCGRSEG